MQNAQFRSTVSQHRCSRYATLMKPYSQGRTTVTFFYDPQRAATFVWLTANTEDGSPVPVDGGAYRLERDWHISLFTDNARRVWEELLGQGWRAIAVGGI